jgi:hypothetical protein
MYMKKINVGLVFLIIFSLAVVNIAQAAQTTRRVATLIIQKSAISRQSLSRIKVGANLREYRRPNRRQCNINVPKQYSTIKDAVDAAVVGDTVCIGAGIYNENVVINKSIRLSGSGATRSIINGQTTDATVYVAGDGNADNVIVEGFLINGVDGTGLSDPATFIIGPFASGAIVRYNKIVAGNAELAVRASSGQNNVLIYNNVFVGNNSHKLVLISGVQGPAYKVDFISNTFTGTVNQTYPDSGRVLETWATNSLIQRNVFDAGGDITTVISSSYPSNIVSENNLNSNALVKVGTYSGGTLIAENNWWGDLDPSDNIHGDVDFTPFAIKPFKQY